MVYVHYVSKTSTGFNISLRTRRFLASSFSNENTTQQLSQPRSALRRSSRQREFQTFNDTKQGNLSRGFSLERVPKEGRIVATVLLQELLISSILKRVLVLAVSACVLPTEVERHADGKETTHGSRGEEDEMARSVARSLDGTEDEGRDGTTKVTLKMGYQQKKPRLMRRRVRTYKANMHSDTNTALQRSTDVVAVPGHTLGNVGVDA